MKRIISLILMFSMAFLLFANIVYASEIDNTSFEKHTIRVLSNVKMYMRIIKTAFT